MSTITITPESSASKRFRAVRGSHVTTGSSIGNAIDEMAKETGFDRELSVVIVNPMQPDQFFSAAQRDRLSDLMAQWRTARDHHQPFAVELKRDLDELIKTELVATMERAKYLARSLPS